MDQRTLQAVVISLMIYLAWLTFFAPEPPPDVEDVALVEQLPAGEVRPGQAPDVAVPQAPSRDVPVRLCTLSAAVATGTGALHGVSLPDTEAPYDVQPLWRWALSGFPSPWLPYGAPPGPEVLLGELGLGLSVGAGPLTQLAPSVEVVEEVAGRLVTRARSSEGVEITRTLTAGGAPCRVTVEITWRNTASSPFGGGVWVGVHDVLREQVDRYALAARPKAYVDGGMQSLDDLDELVAPVPLDGPVGFAGLADNYFAFLLAPEQVSGPLQAVFSNVRVPVDDTEAVAHGVHLVMPDTLQPGASATARFAVYAGPKELDQLKAAAPILGEAVELGFFSALAWPLLWLLKKLHGILGNWGAAIIALTFLVKAAFFRLTQRSFRSSQAMQAVQPQLTLIRERFKDDPEGLNRETLKLFQESGVNPLGGCLPMLVQMPVWFALYSVLLSSVEIYHTDFLYLRDLSAADPYLVLPTLAMLLMIGQQQLMPTGGMDPAQARMMKLMPIVFGVFFYSFPSGLVLYILVNMTLSMLQQWYIKRSFEKQSA